MLFSLSQRLSRLESPTGLRSMATIGAVKYQHKIPMDSDRTPAEVEAPRKRASPVELNVSLPPPESASNFHLDRLSHSLNAAHSANPPSDYITDRLPCSHLNFPPASPRVHAHPLALGLHRLPPLTDLCPPQPSRPTCHVDRTTPLRPQPGRMLSSFLSPA